MNKKWLLIIALVLVVSALFVVLKIKKSNRPLKNNLSSPGSISVLAAEARNLELKGNLWDAKAKYQQLLNEFPGSSEVMNWQKRIEDLNMRLLFSPTITPKSISYEIKSGDTLGRIAKQFNTTVELLKKSNGLTDDKILVGRQIKVWTAPFSILVDKSQNLLILKSNEEIIKTYTVSTGANNSTPVGKFKIVTKLIDPTWFKAGAIISPDSPENILGTRWLGFDLAGYGIHGTTDPKSLGKQVTQGCVRMANPDVEELYTVVPLDTEVTVVD